MKIECEIDTYDNQVITKNPKLEIKRHWNRYRDLVVLSVEGKTVTVSRDDLIKAIEACTR